jgi:hypothetical protein
MKRYFVAIFFMAVQITVYAQLKVYRNGDVTIGLTNQSQVSKLAVGGTVTAHGVIVPFEVADSAFSLSEDESGDILKNLMAMSVVSYVTPVDEYEEDKQSEIIHYALSPEVMQQLFPSLVSDHSGEVKGVNYTEMIPLLVRCIQQQQYEIESLKASLTSLSAIKGDALNSFGTNSRYSATLLQNTPNPVREQTTIAYSLAGSFNTANINIADIYGNMVKTYPVPSGSGSITVNASELGIGMFLYSLVVDNTIVDSKKLVVTK